MNNNQVMTKSDTRKEHPILFSTAMVKAILEGRKTQTRRVIKPQINADEVGAVGKSFFTPDGMVSIRGVHDGVPGCEWFRKLPYGLKGDLLWVRETFRLQNFARPNGRFSADICYRADGAIGERVGNLSDNERIGWRPSIHMPRWASRITLEVTGVRVERVKDITLDGVFSEGITAAAASSVNRNPVGYFRNLWDTINAKRGYGWDVNPWVWVVEFKRVEVGG